MAALSAAESPISESLRLSETTPSMFSKQALGQGKRVWRFWYDRLNNAGHLSNMLSNVSL
jgi:hypothetical protein